MFSCLIAPSGVLSKMLKEIDEERHLYCIPNLRKRGFHLWGLGLAMDFLRILFIRLKKLFSIPSMLGIFFNHESVLRVVRLFAFTEIITCFPPVLCFCGTLCFQILIPPDIPRTNLIWLTKCYHILFLGILLIFLF
jgi:hypothetical protein